LKVTKASEEFGFVEKQRREPGYGIGQYYPDPSDDLKLNL